MTPSSNGPEDPSPNLLLLWGRVSSGRLRESVFANDPIRLSSVLEAPVMHASVNLGRAICVRGSKPTRRIRADPTRVRSSGSLQRFPRDRTLTCLPQGARFERPAPRRRIVSFVFRLVAPVGTSSFRHPANQTLSQVRGPENPRNETPTKGAGSASGRQFMDQKETARGIT